MCRGSAHSARWARSCSPWARSVAVTVFLSTSNLFPPQVPTCPFCWYPRGFRTVVGLDQSGGEARVVEPVETTTGRRPFSGDRGPFGRAAAPIRDPIGGFRAELPVRVAAWGSARTTRVVVSTSSTTRGVASTGSTTRGAWSRRARPPEGSGLDKLDHPRGVVSTGSTTRRAELRGAGAGERERAR